MEFTIQKSKLQEELSNMMGVIEKKNSIQILENVLISPNGTGIKLAATSIDLGLYSNASIEILHNNPGEAICTPCRKFFDIVRSMPEGLVRVRTDDSNWVHVEAILENAKALKSSKFRIPGASPILFPELPALPAEGDWLSVSAKTFRTALRGVEFAMAAEDDKRYAITGIKVELNDKGITAVATNGSRLAIATGPIDALLLEDMDFLIPRKTISELLKFIGDSTDDMEIAISANQMFFRLGAKVLYTRLLTGQYPNYEMVLTNTLPHFVTFKADDLAASIKRALLVADERSTGIILDFKDSKVDITAKTAEAGECSQELDSNFNGPPAKIPVNGQFLLDFLGPVGQDIVKIELKDGSMPLFLKAVKGTINHHYVVSPMRL